MRGKVAHVSYYEKTMSSSREGYSGDLVVKDEFIRFYVEFIRLTMGTENSGAIDASDENLDIGFSTDEGVDCGGVE